MEKLGDLTNIAVLQALLDVQHRRYSRQIDAEGMTAALNERVKGQEHVTGDLARLLQEKWAKESRRRPVANLLVVGAGGTGKTELVKALAEYIYQDQKAILLFDCGELQDWEAKARLVGREAYVGGFNGRLTVPLFNNPKRLIVFEEIEQAHPEVLDLLVEMMGEGRVTDGNSGRAADCTQSIVILTTRMESTALGKLREEIGDPRELENAVKTHLVATGMFRPEIAGRLDRLYVFKPLDRIAFAAIAALKMKLMARDYGLELVDIGQAVVRSVVEETFSYGIRHLEPGIDALAGEQFSAARERGWKRVRLDIGDGGSVVTEVE